MTTRQAIAKEKIVQDVRIQDEGNIYLLFSLTDAAREWVDENLPTDATTWGNGIVVEHRYVRDIVCGMVEDGLIVGD